MGRRQAIEQLLERAARDPVFAKSLAEDPFGAASAAGIRLTLSERAVLRATEAGTINRTIAGIDRRRFVGGLLAAGTVLSDGCAPEMSRSFSLGTAGNRPGDPVPCLRVSVVDIDVEGTVSREQVRLQVDNEAFSLGYCIWAGGTKPVSFWLKMKVDTDGRPRQMVPRSDVRPEMFDEAASCVMRRAAHWRFSGSGAVLLKLEVAVTPPGTCEP